MQFNYSPNLDGLVIIKTEQEQFDEFFSDGHPNFLIPQFGEQFIEDPNYPGIPYTEDIWTSFMTYLERKYDKPIYDQDGGEVISHSIVDSHSGFTKCVYEAYGINFNDEDEMVDIKVEIEGYVVKGENYAYFLATQVIEHSNF